MYIMKNVLYVGNALSKSGKNITSIETLSQHLSEAYNVKTASSRSNIILRLLDMIGLVLRNESKTDIVLIDTYSTLNFYYTLIISQICRLFTLEYIPILHGGDLESRLKNSPKISKLIFNNAEFLVSPSNFLKSKFEAYGYKNVVFIPNSIEIDNYEFMARDIDSIKLLWVRSISELYNPKLAILVLEALIAKGYKAELTMVGPDNNDYLKEVKQFTLNKNLNVNFTGKLTKLEWILLSKTHNMFLNTTNFDNAPVSIIEAMALGLPIVSTNVGGLPFLIEDYSEGILVEPEDEEAMVQAIITLRNDKVLKDRLVINGRKKAETFNWLHIKPSWISLLQ
tara:strand:+ start:79749 stop:80765 length:1017 start_codon:yes stop_codon:yes gene_type:complete